MQFLSKIFLILLIVFIGIMVLASIYFIIRQIRIMFLFTVDKYNPYNRKCTKCGAHQVMYQSNIEGMEHWTWWEEVYPIGNNEKCKCHKYAEYHS